LEVGLAAVWLARQASMPVAGLAELMLTLFFACAAGAATALFCSVFLHPLLALPATAILLLFPYVAELNGFHAPGYFFPVSATLHLIFNFSFQPPGNGLLPIALAALIHVAIFWLAATAIFARQDVTVAPE
jgi:hypothetical protein